MQVQNVYQEHRLQEPRWLAQARQSIQANVAWLDRNSAATCAWLPAQGL